MIIIIIKFLCILMKIYVIYLIFICVRVYYIKSRLNSNISLIFIVSGLLVILNLKILPEDLSFFLALKLLKNYLFLLLMIGVKISRRFFN